MNPIVQWVVTLALSIGTFLYTYFRNRGTDAKALEERFEKKLKEIQDEFKAELRQMHDSHASMKERQTAQETKIDVFWKKVTFTMGEVLHQPHPEAAEMDYLLDRFSDETITVDEMKDLIARLKRMKYAHDEKGIEQLAAAFMLAGIEMQEHKEIFARALRESGH